MIMSLLGVVHTTPSGLLQYLLKRIYLNLPTMDLALFTTNLLTDNMLFRPVQSSAHFTCTVCVCRLWRCFFCASPAFSSWLEKVNCTDSNCIQVN